LFEGEESTTLKCEWLFFFCLFVIV